MPTGKSDQSAGDTIVLSHSTIDRDGWEEVANHALDRATKEAPAHAASNPPRRARWETPVRV